MLNTHRIKNNAKYHQDLQNAKYPQNPENVKYAHHPENVKYAHHPENGTYTQDTYNFSTRSGISLRTKKRCSSRYLEISARVLENAEYQQET